MPKEVPCSNLLTYTSPTRVVCIEPSSKQLVSAYSILSSVLALGTHREKNTTTPLYRAIFKEREISAGPYRARRRLPGREGKKQQGCRYRGMKQPGSGSHCKSERGWGGGRGFTDSLRSEAMVFMQPSTWAGGPALHRCQMLEKRKKEGAGEWRSELWFITELNS